MCCYSVVSLVKEKDASKMMKFETQTESNRLTYTLVLFIEIVPPPNPSKKEKTPLNKNMSCHFLFFNLTLWGNTNQIGLVTHLIDSKSLQPIMQPTLNLYD